jgi:hypothetical protein
MEAGGKGQYAREGMPAKGFDYVSQEGNSKEAQSYNISL